MSPSGRMAKLKSVHQCTSSRNMTKLALFPYLEKVKTMRCFWEMKFEPQVSMQFTNSLEKILSPCEGVLICFLNQPFESAEAPAEGANACLNNRNAVII